MVFSGTIFTLSLWNAGYLFRSKRSLYLRLPFKWPVRCCRKLQVSQELGQSWWSCWGRSLITSFESQISVGEPTIIVTPPRDPVLLQLRFVILLYGYETWPNRVEEARRLSVFDQWCLRSTARIWWEPRMNNDGVRLPVLGVDSRPLTTIIALHHLLQLGHVLLVLTHRLHFRALFGMLERSGRRHLTVRLRLSMEAWNGSFGFGFDWRFFPFRFGTEIGSLLSVGGADIRLTTEFIGVNILWFV